MEFEIEYAESIVKKEKVNVDFPFYFSMSDVFDDGGGYQSCYKMEENGSFFCLTERNYRRDSNDYEFKRGSFSRTEMGNYIKKYGIKYYQDTAERDYSLTLKKLNKELESY